MKLDYNYEHIFEVLARRAGRPHGLAPVMKIFEKLKNLNLIILNLEYKFEVFEVLARRAGCAYWASPGNENFLNISKNYESDNFEARL